MKIKKFLVIFLMTLLLVSGVFALMPPTYAVASGSLTYAPNVFASGASTAAVVSGGNFGSGSTVYFYISTTTNSKGIIGNYIGSYTLGGGITSLSDSHVTLTIPNSVSSGSYYLLAGDSSSISSSQFTSPTSVTVSSLTPTLRLTGTQPTALGTATGSGWDPGATISLYLLGADGTAMNSQNIATFTTTVSGTLPSGSSFTIPSVSEGTYEVVAQETSAASPNYGITADSPMSITPVVSVSPVDISGSQGTVIYVTGNGFPSLSSVPANGITAGGVSTVSKSTVASSTGSFYVTSTLSSSISTAGEEPLTVKYNNTQYTQPNAFFVSSPNPTQLGFVFSITQVSGYYYPGSGFTATVYNFPSTSSVSILLGGSVIGQVETDSNGYGNLIGIIPAIPAGSYIPVAASSGLYKDASQITLSPYFEITDPSGSLMTRSYNEFMPSGGAYNLIAYGLTPESVYTFSDSGAGALSYKGSHVLSVSSGTQLSPSSLEFIPASNGTLAFKFGSVYSSASVFEQVALSSVTGYGGNTFGYSSVGIPSFSISSFTIMVQNSVHSLTVNNLIPKGSNTYQGLSYIYSLYLGNSELSVSTSSGTSTTITTSSPGSTATTSLSITIPSVGDGVYNLSIFYYGHTFSSPVYSSPMVISSPSSSPSSGELTAVPISRGGMVVGYNIVGTGFGESPKLYYMTYTGNNGPYAETLTDGAFVFSGISSTPSEPSGNYSVIAVVTYGGQTYEFYTSYAVKSTLSLGLQSGTIFSSVPFTASGLSPSTYYNVLFGGIEVSTFATGTSGFSSSSFLVPLLPQGAYNVTLSSVLTKESVVSSSFVVQESSSLSLGVNEYAFPGQVVNFTWTPSSLPTSLHTQGPIFVTVYLNGSALTTTVVNYPDTPLSGAFTMPNSNPGTYWELTLGWNTNQSSYMMSSSDGAYLQLVSGNGALVTGITSSEMVTVVTSVDNAVNASMQIPLKELDAAVVSIEGTSALINTSFGLMKASLASINSSIVDLVNGEAIIQTSLGSVQASINDLNASIVSVKMGEVELSTDAGFINTTLSNLVPEISDISASTIRISTVVGSIDYNLSAFSKLQLNAVENGSILVSGEIQNMSVSLTATLSSLNATIISTANGVSGLLGSSVTIKTSLGNISGRVINVQNGIATIQTSLGNLNTTTGSIMVTGKNSSNYINLSFIIDLAMGVIAVIILVLVAMIYSRVRKR